MHFVNLGIELLILKQYGVLERFQKLLFPIMVTN
nr:MAG TPA: hypothetical protein [Caudoviricetes sp.]